MIEHVHLNLCRRAFLKMGLLSPLALSLSAATGKNVVAAQESIRKKLLPVFLIYLGGGASYKETFDPDSSSAPAEYRGEFQSIKTEIPGCRFSEHWSKTAKQADMLAVIRGITTEDHNHATSTEKMFMPDKKVTLAVRCGEKGASDDGIPYGLVEVPSGETVKRDAFQENRSLVIKWHSKDEGSSAGDLPVPGDYLPPEFRTDPHLMERKRLLETLDTSPLSGRVMEDMMKHRKLAFSLLTGDGEFMKAFHPAPSEQSEYERDLERYGNNPVGKGLLLGRRLIERGTGCVTINHADPDAGNWDDHYDIFNLMKKQVPPLDKALAALLEDLRDNRFDAVVAVLTEFGRTPKVNRGGGRDHWGTANTMLLTGSKRSRVRRKIVSGKTHHDGTVLDGQLKAQEGAVVNTIIHAATLGRPEEFLAPNEPRAWEALR